MKTVYSYYVLDLLHKGHLQMMQKSKEIAGKDGKLIIGILTDQAVMEKKPRPILSFEERMEIARAIKYVDQVIPQDTYSPLPNVMKIMPDVLMESSSHDEADIQKVRECMEKMGGQVIVVPYYSKQSSTMIKNKIRQTPQP